MLDFDGTLVDIAPTPSQILVPPSLPILLQKLQKKHNVWIISGRHRDTLKKFIPDFDKTIGLHGLQWPGSKLDVNKNCFTPLVEKINNISQKYPGIHIEDKIINLSIHYRNVKKNKDRLYPKLLNIITDFADSIDYQVLLGHQMLEVLPKNAKKSIAIQKLINKFPDHLPVFIGDDITDEEGFVAINNAGGLSIRFNSDNTSKTISKKLLKNPNQVINILRQLI